MVRAMEVQTESLIAESPQTLTIGEDVEEGESVDFE